MRFSYVLFGGLFGIIGAAGCSDDVNAPASGAQNISSGGGGAGGSGTGGSGDACIPGAQVACACPGGSQGVQVCEPDGQSLGPCQCGTGGSGGGGNCQPGDTLPCYTGPSNTEDVGTCTAGVATCAADGSGYGACQGETLPSSDDCVTPEDEDCDGAPALCPGALWAKVFGDAAHPQGGVEIAVDVLGNVILLSRFAGSVDFGGGNLTATGIQQYDIGVAKFDPQGNHLWSKRFGDDQYQEATGIAVDAQGNVIVVAMVAGSIDFGGGVLFAQDTDLGIVKLDPQGGYLWGTLFGDATAQVPQAVAVDSTGAIVVGGGISSTGHMDLGGGNIPGTGNMFVVKLDASGGYLWGKQFGSPAGKGSSLRGLGVDATGAVYYGGHMWDYVDFGGGNIGMDNGGDNVFVAKCASDGTYQWAKSFGDTNADQQLEQLAVDPAGNIAITGSYRSVIDFGGGPLPDVGTSFQKLGAFAALLDSDGNHVVSGGYNGGALDAGTGTAFDAAGNAYFYGHFSGSIDFGGGVVSGNGLDIYLLKVDPTGAFLNAAAFGVSGQNYSAAMASAPGGAVLLTGSIDGVLDFGNGQTQGASGGDIFLAKLVF